jgi:hypothetical protein
MSTSRMLMRFVPASRVKYVAPGMTFVALDAAASSLPLAAE